MRTGNGSRSLGAHRGQTRQRSPAGRRGQILFGRRRRAQLKRQDTTPCSADSSCTCTYMQMGMLVLHAVDRGRSELPLGARTPRTRVANASLTWTACNQSQASKSSSSHPPGNFPSAPPHRHRVLSNPNMELPMGTAALSSKESDRLLASQTSLRRAPAQLHTRRDVRYPRFHG